MIITITDSQGNVLDSYQSEFVPRLGDTLMDLGDVERRHVFRVELNSDHRSVTVVSHKGRHNLPSPT